jgi:protein tyrosine phosphatase (PTP) superfamily phosphohydrolase (DUF442 family)
MEEVVSVSGQLSVEEASFSVLSGLKAIIENGPLTLATS